MKNFKFEYKGLREVNARNQSQAFKMVRKEYPNIKNVTEINLTEIK